MAKKKKETIEESIVKETVVVEQPKVEAPKIKAKPKDTWEIKNRTYFLKGKERTSLSRSIQGSNIYYFDEEKGYQRELK